MDEAINFAKGLKIFTLNCWGLRYVSQHRESRIKSIAHYLKEQDYDIVFLQEIWCEPDFEYLKETTKSKFKFAHMFKNSSLVGTSGLAVLLNFPVSRVHFESFFLNGTPFKFWHGDWFTSKGIGYVRVDLKHVSMHLFCTHMHAQYDRQEDKLDQYSIHRICQSYQLAKFINLITNDLSNDSNINLIILGGDLNTASNEIPYKLLVSMTNLLDCYHPDPHCIYKIKKQDYLEGAGDYAISDQFISEDEIECVLEEDANLITVGHHANSFTPVSDGLHECKRIDFIMFKLLPRHANMLDKQKNDLLNELMAHEKHCKLERLKSRCKDPETGLSFSDHQPVSIKLNLNLDASLKRAGGQFCASCKIQLLADNETNSLEIVETYGIEESMSGKENKSDSKSDEHDMSMNREYVPDTLVDLSIPTSESIQQHGLSKCTKSGPLHLKHQETNKPNVYPAKLDSVSIKRNMLEKTNSLLNEYFRLNQVMLTRVIYIFFFLLLVISSFSMAIVTHAVPSFMCSTILYLFSILFPLATIALSIVNMIHRYEQNAIRSFINDINCDLSVLK